DSKKWNTRPIPSYSYCMNI
ncbi:hypothetical protein CCACVL1_01077, partial [Corchorus capsularis]